MVKPQLNLEKKDEPKKPDGSLVKVVTIADEPAPLNPEPVYSQPQPRGGRHACKCFSLCLLIGFFFLLSFLCIGYFVHHRFRSSYGFCGVGYYDDWDYDFYDDVFWGSSAYNYEPDGMGGKIPYGDDMLVPPRPSGPPLERFLEEGVKIEVDLKFVRISHPGDEMYSSVDVVHDFNVNMSAYLMVATQECYLRPLNYASTLEPQDFHDLMETEAYREQAFPMLSEIYTVNPEKVYDMELIGPNIQGLCDGVDAYYIHNIPSDQWPNFLEIARSVLRDHLGSSSEDHEGYGGEGRGHHGGRHGGHSGGRHGGRHGSQDRSSEEDGIRHRRFARLREYMENVRTFDGKSVTDMHIFQSHNLDGLSQENVDKLSEVAGGFMP